MNIHKIQKYTDFKNVLTLPSDTEKEFYDLFKQLAINYAKISPLAAATSPTIYRINIPHGPLSDGLFLISVIVSETSDKKLTWTGIYNKEPRLFPDEYENGEG